jgi:hypothetical protein
LAQGVTNRTEGVSRSRVMGRITKGKP